MHPRLINGIFATIALAAIGVAGWVYYFSPSTGEPARLPTASPATTVSPKIVSPSPTLSPGPSPSAGPEASQTDKLSLPATVATVQSGESVATLAARHAVTVDAIAKVNNLADPNKVFSGQKLTIPDNVSGADYTILFVTNQQRLAKEKQRTIQGLSSVYQDAVTAAIADCAGLFGLGADTPLSANLNDTGTQGNLTTTNSSWTVTIGMAKNPDGLWTVSRLIAKAKPTPSPSPSP